MSKFLVMFTDGDDIDGQFDTEQEALDHISNNYGRDSGQCTEYDITIYQEVIQCTGNISHKRKQLLIRT